MKFKPLFLTLLFAFLIVSCHKKSKNKGIPLKIVESEGHTIEVYDFVNFEKLLHQNNDTTYVVNFWATWCKPCVEELPAFKKLAKEYHDEKVKVILVSLDFPNKIENNVIPFIIKNELKLKVIVLDDPDQNTWIPKVSKDWLGSIPATIIYKKDKRSFYEQSFSYELLNKELLKFI